jgi:hypothetical protein
LADEPVERFAKVEAENTGKNEATIARAAARQNENARDRAAGGKFRNEIDVCNMPID